MFVENLLKRNPDLINQVYKFHRENKIDPDTFVIDLDTFLINAKKLKENADKKNIRLFFMLKQLGRNPYLARKLVDIGYDGAVVVDFREAQIMMKNNIPICNAGHLVQIPNGFLKKLMSYGAEFITVYSLEKLELINTIARELGIVQKIMVRVVSDDDLLYDGQEAGFFPNELEKLLQASKQLKNIEIKGVTNFPTFLYDESSNTIKETNNLSTLKKAVKFFRDNNIEIEEINMPSATSIANLDLIKEHGGTSGEPGHGLTASTPLSKYTDTVELPCVCYLTEVSHNFKNKSKVYGGGIYRRGHMEKAIVKEYDSSQEIVKIKPTNLESIDYYFELDKQYDIGTTVILSFRFQIFVTRSNVVIIEGIRNNKAKIVGIYNSLGDKYEN